MYLNLQAPLESYYRSYLKEKNRIYALKYMQGDPAFNMWKRNIHEGLDASELVRMFDEKYGNVGYKGDLETDLASLMEEPMCLCREGDIHKHGTMKTYSINTHHDPRLLHPLLIHIDVNKTTILELYLRAGVPAGLMREQLRHRPMNGTWSIFWSAVESACFVDRPDILGLLVSYDQSHRRRYKLDKLNNDDDYDSDTCVYYERSSPLHIIMTLAPTLFYKKLHTSEHERMKLSLPSLVQLVLDAGGSVKDLDYQNNNSLHYLFMQVPEMTSDDVHLTTEGHQAVVETVKILLKAGALHNCIMGTLYFLLTCCYGYGSSMSHWSNEHWYKLVFELVELLLKPDGDKCARGSNSAGYTIVTAARYVSYYENITDASQKISAFDQCNAAVDRLGELFSLFQLSGTGKMFLDVRWDKCLFGDEDDDDQQGIIYSIISYERNDIIRSFSSIAEFSSKTGHSKRLIQFILDGMSSTQLAGVKNMLSVRLVSVTSADPLDTSKDNDLKLLREVERPFRLQHLARRTIARSLHGKRLPGAPFLPHVKLPDRLRQYLAYY